MNALNVIFLAFHVILHKFVLTVRAIIKLKMRFVFQIVKHLAINVTLSKTSKNALNALEDIF